MKRFVAMIVSFVVLLSAFALADDVTFRDIPWGSSVEALEKSLKADGGYVSSMDGYPVPYAALFKTSHSKQGFATLEGGSYQTREGIGWFTNAFFMTPLKVGGYDVPSVTTYAFYGLSDGVISKDKKDAVFYAAEYTFEVRDKEAAYNDLKEKLSILYGNVIEIEDNDSLTSLAGDSPIEIKAKMHLAMWDIRGEDVFIVLNMESNDGPEDDINATAWYNCLTLSYIKTSYEPQMQKLDAMMGGQLDEAEKENAVSDFGGL